MTNAVKILKKARAILKDGAWTQGVYARDLHGYPTDLYDKNACSFCLTGALLRGRGIRGNQALAVAEEALQKELGLEHLPSWNDQPERTHEEVLDLLDRTIERLKK